MASLAELRDALTSLGLSTSTGSLRGEARRAALEERLRVAQQPLSETKAPKPIERPQSHGNHDFRHLSLSELRAALEARQLSTHTPGLKGEARRHALIQRLENASRTHDDHDDDEAVKTARSWSSSYSAASEFLFFDTSSIKQKAQEPTVPALDFPVHYSSNDHKSEIFTIGREQLERELMRLRKELHELRFLRSQATSRRLHDAGYPDDLEALSSAMARLENERQRLFRVAFAHELVMTTAPSGFQVELIQQDAVALIEKQQDRLRHQIECVKQAIALSQNNQDDDVHDAQLQEAIHHVERQLQAYGSSRGSSRSSSSLMSITSSAETLSDTSQPVLMRCRSVPSHAFHDTWQALDDTEKLQLQQELRTTKSFRIQRDRIRVGDTPTVSSALAALTRSPPTRADKLGVQALFLEQTHRSPSDICRVYEQALAADPDHAIVLGQYARFVHEKCHDIDRAEALFERAVRADPSVNAAAYATFLHHARRKYDEAEHWYTQALQVAPDDPRVLGNYASLLRKRANGRVAELRQAKDLLTRALTVDPRSVSNRVRLCAVMEDMGDRTHARQGYEELVVEMDEGSEKSDLSPTHTVAHVFGNFANFLMRNGDFMEAKALYLKALRLQPHDALLQRNFSLLLREVKRRTPQL